jgi:hypothetical protein
MMNGASGITLSGGTFTNIGGTIRRPMAPSVAATFQPDEPVDVDENDTIITSAFHKVDNLTVTAGATVKIDNIGSHLMPGQRPKKGQNTHTSMFEGLTNSTIAGGEYTNASSVTYYESTPSGGMLPSDFTSFVSRSTMFDIGDETPDKGI